MSEVKVENKKLLQSIDILESKRRKNNVIIFGIDEHENAESPVTTVENICEQLDVAINPGTITDAYRVGRNKGKRPIVCTVSSFNKKTEMMQKNKAKGQFAILHDLTKKERREKKELKEKLDDVRSRGYHAYIRHGNLIVEGQTFTREDLLGNAAVPLTAEKKGDTQRVNAAALHPPTNPDISPVQMVAVSPELPDTRKLCAPLSVTSRKKPVTPTTPERTPSVKRAAPASQRTVPARRNLPSQQPASAVGGLAPFLQRQRVRELIGCDQCPRTFKKKKTLEDHKRNYHSPGGNVCQLCFKSYSTPGNLQTHQRFLHGIVRNETCCVKCGVDLRNLDALRVHMLTCRTDELVPCVCSLCNRTFKHRKSLKEHVLVYHSEHACCYCQQSFHQTTELLTHIAKCHRPKSDEMDAQKC